LSAQLSARAQARALKQARKEHEDELAHDKATLEQNLRFQGQYLDRDTGLHYNTFRYYDADIGRFISPDPMGTDAGLNLHRYAPNPVAWTDPLGLEDGDGLKRMNVQDSGHHAPAVRKSQGRPFEMSRSDKSWPTIFPKGSDPEHAHWKLHQAERAHVGPRQGSFAGTDAELFKAYEKAYGDKSLKGMKVDLRSPDGTVVLGRNISPKTAIKRMQTWLKGQGRC
jgi:RHS repeat-associated protein